MQEGAEDNRDFLICQKSSHLGLWETTSHKLAKLSILLMGSACPPSTLRLTHTSKHGGDP